MPDYNNSKIYVLKNTTNIMVYIGHTTQTLTKRNKNHKSQCRHFKNNINSNRHQKYLYDYINRIGWDNWYIELIEKYPCKNLEEITKRERYWTEKEIDKNLGNVLNKEIPGREHKELIKLKINKIKKKKYNNDYNKNNKDKRKLYNKKYFKNNKTKIKQKQKLTNSKPYYCCYCDKVLKYGSRLSHNKGITHIKNKNNFENKISEIFSKKLNIKFIKEEKSIIKNKQCKDCKKIISNKAIRCISCASIKSNFKNRKVKNRPSLEDLLELKKTMSMVAIGKKYGVSCNCIRKWIKIYQK